MQEFTVNPTQSLARKVVLRPAIQPFLISIVLGVKLVPKITFIVGFNFQLTDTLY